MKKKEIRFSKNNNVNIKYSLYHSLDRAQWEVWITKTLPSKSESGAINTYCIFEGTKSECEKKINELNKHIIYNVSKNA